MVIYFPRGWRGELAGKGVWYGRVEPRHVWGIVEETVRGGKVVEELCRGVHGGLGLKNERAILDSISTLVYRG